MAMPIEIEEYDGGRTIEVIANGKLEREDYQQFVPHFEKRLEEFGEIGILFVMKDFDGFAMWALWEDIKFEWNHYDDIARLAMVGDSDWKDWMSKFCKPFLKSEIEDFPTEEIDQARAWVRAHAENK